jgi:hypothetical protein
MTPQRYVLLRFYLAHEIIADLLLLLLSIVLFHSNFSPRSELIHVSSRPQIQQLTGFIVGFLMWQEVLEDIFANGVNGVDCVISTQHKSYTWEIVDGSPVFKYVFLYHVLLVSDRQGNETLLLIPLYLSSFLPPTFSLSLSLSCLQR